MYLIRYKDKELALANNLRRLNDRRVRRMKSTWYYWPFLYEGRLMIRTAFFVVPSPCELLVDIMVDSSPKRRCSIRVYVDVLSRVSFFLYSWKEVQVHSTRDKTMLIRWLLYPITQQHITCSLIPMAACLVWHCTTTSSLSRYACCNAYNIIPLHHLPSICKYFKMQSWMSSHVKETFLTFAK